MGNTQITNTEMELTFIPEPDTDKGFFIYEDQKFPLRKVIHSIKRDFITEEEWLDYDTSGVMTMTQEWSFITHQTTNNKNKRRCG